MSKNKQIIGSMNPFGYEIKAEDIDRILDLQNQIGAIERKHLKSFFNKIAIELTKELLFRYAKACGVMTHISFGSYHDEIYNKLIDSIASAKRCYSYSENLACIELCALSGEMLANFLCITKDDNCNSNKYDGFNQNARINLLSDNAVISMEDKCDLLEIHKIRVKYFHRWNQQHDDMEVDALKALGKISKVASDYLELLDNPDNVKKIRQFLENSD